MSGGSYDYLYIKDVDALWEGAGACSNLMRMHDALEARYPHMSAAKDTKALIDKMSQYMQELEDMSNRLRDVWKAVEWCDSGDWGGDKAAMAVAKYEVERDIK